jgi:hypothetical protein
MTEPIFDHERLDVYRLAIKYSLRLTESGWQNQSETDRVDVDSVDPTDGNGGREYDRVRVPRC